ncbi:MAG: GNAT family N-acetyltransferase, partial [Candidatus Sulfotelmatobacter sp.]
LPSLLVDVADNQKLVAKELECRGCAIHAGDSTISSAVIAARLKGLIGSPELRQSLSRRSHELVDSYGARRVVSVLCGPIAIRLRRARSDDARLVWEWANDPEVRAASFSSAPIPWEAHARWFEEKSQNGMNLFLIAEDGDGRAFGQIRFDFDETDAQLSFSIAREKRGLGLASSIVQEGVREVWAQTSCARVHAFVKAGNASSARTFLKAGFKCEGLQKIQDNDALHFVCARG